MLDERKFKEGDRVHYVGEYFPNHREGEWIVDSAHQSVTEKGIYWIRRERTLERLTAYQRELIKV